MRFPAAALAVIAALCLAVLSAKCARADGAEHHHPGATYTGDVAKFYETWMRPDNPHWSCCSKQDCAPADGVRVMNGKWQARPRGGGEEDWITIPPEKIERNRDSPDGRSHLCIIGQSVICFIHGAGT